MTISSPVTTPLTDATRHLAEQMLDFVCICRGSRIEYINAAGAHMLGVADAACLVGQEWPAAGEELVALEPHSVLPSGAVGLVLRTATGGALHLGADIVALEHGRRMIRARPSDASPSPGDDCFRPLVAMAHECLCLCVHGEIRFVNPAGQRLLGGALVGRRLVELIHAEDQPAAAGGLRALAGTGHPLALRMVALDGRVVEVELTVRAFGPPEDDSHTVAARDMSAISHTARALREREHRLRGIVDAVGEAIVTADRNGIIQSFNPAATRIFGYQAEDVIGRNVSHLVAEPARSQHDGYLHDYRATGRSAVLGLGREATGRRSDGSDFPVEINVAEWQQEGERLLIGIIRDITERKRVEEARRRDRDELEERVEERTLELRRLSRQNEQILNSAGEGIIGLDGAGTITFANPSAAEATGWKVRELVGRRARDVLLNMPDPCRGSGSRRPEPLLPLDPRFPATRESIDLMLCRRDGTSFPVEFALAPIEEEGQPVGAVIVFRDITERKLIEDKLRLAAAVFETTAEAIIVLDPSFRVTTINPAFTAITGHSAADVIGRPPPFLSASDAPADLREVIWEAVRRQGRWDHEQWSRRKGGDDYAERLSITAVPDDRGRVAQYIVVFSDITQRKLDEERIRYQANYDSLTGLPNRALFMDRLAQVLSIAERGAHRVGLMFIDLDGFKLVNDTLGHDMGDDLLKEAAQRLQSCVRLGDTVARLGGDEFTIIMPDLGEVADASAAAQRIIDTLELPFALSTNEAFVSASIGIACYPGDAADANALLKNADAAMYRAKEQGKANYQFFTANLNAQVSERLIIKNGLSKALERGEFSLHYQPKCELATGRLTGVEALLRWNSAELGSISPVKFIPVMEENGLIGAVGEWALEMACHQHRLWRDAGHGHMRVAVNLSVRQLRQPELIRTVESILKRTGIEPANLELEITESMIMKDTENAVAVLRSLNDMGIHLAMDDFGTGYSSLSYLKLFPLHTIKIDRSFVRDIATDPDDLEIIRTIITMGHSLRRRIVAEGVETEEQRLLLRKLRCDEMQGYLLSRPMPAEGIDRMLASMTHGTSV